MLDELLLPDRHPRRVADPVLSVLPGTIPAGGTIAVPRPRWLTLLHRTGEAAGPRRAEDLLAAARAELSEVALRREGSMVFITARA